ncbi:MAG: S9 family peptidase [Cyanobacteria bacterium SZAS-4]|nr:S9 family peptidase [Cyanobacteria bacterium SZAS-4]
MKQATGSKRKSTKKPEFNCFQVSTAAHQLYKNKEYKAAAKLFLSHKKDLEKLGNKEEGAAYAYWLLGISLYMCEKYAQCELYLLKAARIYKHLKKADYMNCMWWRGFSQQQRKQYRQAATSFNSACQWSLENDSKNTDWPNRALSQIGFCLWQVKDFDAALEAFEKSLGMSSKASLTNVSSLLDKLLQLYQNDSNNARYAERLRKLAEQASKAVSRKISHPAKLKTEMRPVQDRRFGHVISDPYRWLEDIDSTEVQKWMELQSANASMYLESIPGRSEMLVRIHKLFAIEPPKTMYKSGPFYFTTNKSLSRLYRSDNPGKFPKLVLSVDELPENCTIHHTKISRNGQLVAYWVMTKGSDWQSIYVKNMSTGKRVAGVLKNLRAADMIWGKDDRGFYYSAFSRDSSYSQIKYHKLGTAQSRDKVIYTLDQPDVYASISMTADGKYLMVHTYGTKRDRHSMFLLNIKSARHHRTDVLEEQSSGFYFIGQREGVMYYMTDKNAPMFRIVSVSIKEIEEKRNTNRRAIFREVLPEKQGSLRRSFVWGDFLVCLYTTKNGEVIERWNIKTKKHLEPIQVPIGTSITNTTYMDFPIVRCVVEGYTSPTMVYELDFKAGKFVAKVNSKSDIDISQFVSEKLYARSSDGSKVPFFVRYKKGLKLDGNNPTILTGYGGFFRDVSPSFDYYDLLWMDLGGICVEPILRGDNGLGADWRKAGMRENKQRTFDDFIAVAQTLIRKKYTKPSRLGIYGYSNGGLLAGAVLTQRPELFGAVEIGCGLLDMLRFHKFGTEKHYVSEYGSATSKKYFPILRDYSPLHNVEKREYPPVLLNTGSHDDRVCPAHSYKFAATLQQNQTGDAPILLNIEMNAGHGFSSKSNMGVNRLAFFGYALGLIPKQFLKPKQKTRR